MKFVCSHIYEMWKKKQKNLTKWMKRFHCSRFCESFVHALFAYFYRSQETSWISTSKIQNIHWKLIVYFKGRIESYFMSSLLWFAYLFIIFFVLIFMLYFFFFSFHFVWKFIIWISKKPGLLLKVTVAGKPYSSTKSSDPTSTQYQHFTKTSATGVHFNQLHFVNHFLCLVLWFTKLFIIRYDLSDCLMFSRTLSSIHPFMLFMSSCIFIVSWTTAQFLF